MEWVGLKISKVRPTGKGGPQGPGPQGGWLGVRLLCGEDKDWGPGSGMGVAGRGTQSSVAAKAAVVSGLSFSLEGCSVPVEGATSGKRPGTGRAGKGALRRRRCAGCHDDRTARREPPPPGRERERLAAGSGR
uniref:Uncharacterized protein n=1 Tax=Rangifer tarandus platyrhynchus TaxID=3082113 RepID=A0ACB0FFJ6_RANTA|nr:unnamed protein product [Rangifer tarandus platyrhynchus]